MMPANKFDPVASVSISVTELNSLKSQTNELQARLEAQDQHQILSQNLSQSLIGQPYPVQSETLSLRISQSPKKVSQSQPQGQGPSNTSNSLNKQNIQYKGKNLKIQNKSNSGRMNPISTDRGSNQVWSKKNRQRENGNNNQ